MDNDLPATGEDSEPTTASDATAIRPAARALNAAERRELRAAAHHLDPVIMIGDAGLTPAVVAEADRALERHQLIKVRVLGGDRIERGRIMERLCAALGCSPVQLIGKLLVVWRPAKDAAQGPKAHIPKKQAAQAAERSAKQAKPPLAPRAPIRRASEAEPAKRGAKRPLGAAKPSGARQTQATGRGVRGSERDTPSSRSGPAGRTSSAQGRSTAGSGGSPSARPSTRSSGPGDRNVGSGRGARPAGRGISTPSRRPAAARSGAAGSGRPVSKAPAARKRRTHS